MKLSSLFAIAGLIPVATSKQQILNAFGEPSYGVDVSFPVHYRTFAEDKPLGDRQTLYDDFMAGCREHYSSNSRACDITEEDRVEMSVRQPQSMQVSLSRLHTLHSYDTHLSKYCLLYFVPPIMLRTIRTLDSKKSRHLNISLNYSQTIGWSTRMIDNKRTGLREIRT